LQLVPENQRVDVLVIGAGIAGLVVTLELLEQLDPSKRLLLVDRCHPEEVGGLAREAFGGMFMVDTPEQRRSKIKDSVELALEDWLRVAEFGDEDHWPRRWAEEYVARARDEVGMWLKRHGVRFFPVVNWAERGVYGDGNSVPRFHLTWGCGQALVDQLWGAIEHHPTQWRLAVRLETRVTELLSDGRVVSGCRVEPEAVIEADQIVIAAGGVGGNLEMVRRNWPAELSEPPKEILMGSHYYADGAMHEEVQRIGGNVTHIARMWNYADAVRHPRPRRPLHGVKLIPPRSGLVLDPTGRRYGPIPLMPTFDAYYALQRMCEDPRGYYWMVCNWKIARRELDVSGSEHNPQIREQRLVRFLLSVLLGKPRLVRYFTEHCPDFVTASSLNELADRMQSVTNDGALDPEQMRREVESYDATIGRGKGLFNDDQLRRIESVANWRGDRLRTCRFQRIVDPKAMPLIAIRMTVMARKSLGGIQTDLSSRVLRPDGHPIEGLYAAGEAAGFGGGGMHGKRSLEGTFLGGCVFSGRIAARTIAAGAGQPVSPTAPAGRAPTHAAPGAGAAPALKPTS
jgi:predicted oxidoreductase